MSPAIGSGRKNSRATDARTAEASTAGIPQSHKATIFNGSLNAEAAARPAFRDVADERPLWSSFSPLKMLILSLGGFTARDRFATNQAIRSVVASCCQQN